MRRRTALPFGQTTSWSRLASMIMALVVLAALYFKFKDPATWQIFVEEKNSALMKPAAENSQATSLEQLILGPNDLNEDEARSADELFEFVTDRAPLKSREMDAYWRLMAWSRTEPFDSLEHRSLHDVAFTQLWDKPETYRGKPIRLSLHVRRVLEFESPENPQSIPKVYEAWGWTDESRSYPYVVVFADRPDGLAVGTDIRAEIVFVGYFLKIMAYTAFDHSRGAPLLVGKARIATSNNPASLAATHDQFGPWLFIAVIIVASFAFFLRFRQKSTKAIQLLPEQLSKFVPAGESAAADSHLLPDQETNLNQNPFLFEQAPIPPADETSPSSTSER